MIKKTIKKLIPSFILNYLRIFLNNLEKKKFKKMNHKQIFSEIYKKKLWSSEEAKKKFEYYSGTGSHKEEFTAIYLNKIKEFLQSLSTKPNVVDLGCGDFEIGSKIRPYCKNYIAVDVFDDLIKRNQEKYKDLGVIFKTMDITEENLPEGEVCFLRTVLQHLSNDAILKFLTLMKNKYKFLIVTEHLPENKTFVPNIDMDSGPFIRLDKNSGVDLTKKPFNLDVVSEKILCDIKSNESYKFNGVMNTKVLQLKN